MDMKEIAFQRLRNQQLIQSNLKLPENVVSWLGAIQAQDYTGAKWSLGLRVPNCTNVGVERVIAEKTILRTWLLRGTLHFVLAADIRWMIELVAPRILLENKRRYRELELEEQTLLHSNDLLVKALQTANQLDRKALLSILEINGISTKGQRGVFMLQRASLDGLICQGVTHANNPTFIQLDGFTSKGFERDEALSELARRYFTSRGPATLQDFIWWSGLSVAEARAGINSIQSQFVQETVDGNSYWWPQSMPVFDENFQTVLLLPGFDEYLLAYRNRSASLDVPRYKRMTPPNGMLPATIVFNGQVKGTWKHTIKNDVVLVTPYLFNPLSSAERENVTAAARHLGKFLGMSVVLK
jgi:hypothetical protein